MRKRERRKANPKMTINTIQLAFQFRRGKEECSQDLRFCHRHTSHHHPLPPRRRGHKTKRVEKTEGKLKKGSWLSANIETVLLQI